MQKYYAVRIIGGMKMILFSNSEDELNFRIQRAFENWRATLPKYITDKNPATIDEYMANKKKVIVTIKEIA